MEAPSIAAGLALINMSLWISDKFSLPEAEVQLFLECHVCKIHLKIYPSKRRVDVHGQVSG